jgi:protein-S-isoprenylcysteine O-methyltransferase Ste14
MIIMVTPFAAYFYTVYTPLLHGLEATVATAWLPQFFLPHLAHTKIAVFRYAEWLGAFLALFGLLGFFACAIQLYYGKFIRKKLVTGGLYGRVRHPQYLMLIIGGAGFLLLWPRFFILVTYLVMLGLYYMLARHEEETIRKLYGSDTEAYLARVPMFNPFRKPGENVDRRPLPRKRALTIWLGGFVVCLNVAFGLRAVAISQMYVVHRDSPNVTALSLREMDDDAIDAVVDSTLRIDALHDLLRRNPDMALFMQINAGRSQLRHLLIDLGMMAEARRGLDLPGDGLFVVASEVVSRNPSTQNGPRAFSLSARTVPRLLVSLPEAGGRSAVVELTPDLFYPGFARILF